MIDSPNKILKHIYENAGSEVTPITIEVDLSNRCALGCNKCHFAHTHTKGVWTSRERSYPDNYEDTGDIMDMELAMKILKEIKEVGVRSVVWSGGGEPTSHPEWQTIVKVASSLGLSQGMYTSGVLLTQESARLLASYATWVVVSLDATDEATYYDKKNGSFEKACNGIESLSGHKATVGVSYLLNRDNWGLVYKMMNLAKSLGADYTTFRPEIEYSPSNPSEVIGDLDWITEALPLFKEIQNKDNVQISPERFKDYRDWKGHNHKYCEGVKFSSVITPNGGVWLCCQRRGQTKIGDLGTEKIREVLANHPKKYLIDKDCRVMCRLYGVNNMLSKITEPINHEEFV